MKATPVSGEPNFFDITSKFNNQQFQHAWLLSIVAEKQGVDFWNSQSYLTINYRAEVYPLLILDAIYNKEIINESDFITYELQKYYQILEKHANELNSHPLAHHNILSYINFLEQRQLKLKENELNQKLDEFNKIPSELSRTDLTAHLLFFLKDNGVLAEEISDYQFSKWIEKNFLFQNSQEMKYIKQEISKFRRMEHDTLKIEENIRRTLGNFKIKINDELD